MQIESPRRTSLVSQYGELLENSSSQSGSLENRGTSPFSSDAVISTLGNNRFRTRLEKHLKDYKRGHGNLSKKVASEVRSRDRNNHQFLAEFNPKLSRQYSALLTSLDYQRGSRAVAALQENAATVRAITTASDNAQGLEDHLRSLYAQAGPKGP